jgi:hypothetical protein
VRAAGIPVAARADNEAPEALAGRLAGDTVSNAIATMAKNETMQKTQTHPFEAAGFDKTTLL